MDIEEEVLTMKDPPIRDEVDIVCIDKLKPEWCINISGSTSGKSEGFRLVSGRYAKN